MSSSARGELFIISAPSGAGKTTLIHRLFSAPEDKGLGGLAYSISHTTRPPRAGEEDGRDYYFIDRPGFERRVAAARFLEWAEVHGNLYGTDREAVEAQLVQGRDVVLDIDVQGAEQVLAAHPEAQSVFIAPPSFAELRRRIKGRNLDAAEQISRRLGEARVELLCYQRYRYVIINDDVRRATKALMAIILARRQRHERVESRVQQVLAGFPPAGENA